MFIPQAAFPLFATILFNQAALSQSLLLISATGIAAERLDEIFEPFFTTKAIRAGTGLGLSQADGFAKKSGGEIIVTSEPNVGSVFTIYLPQVDIAADEAHLAGTTSLAVSREGRFVLVVEDNIAVGRFTTELLQDLRILDPLGGQRRRSPGVA